MLSEAQKQEINRIYRNLATDAKRAICLGDVDLSDVIDDSLTPAQQQALLHRLLRWGRSNGVDC